MDDRFVGLPGAELIEAGLADAARGVESDEALLVAIGAPRLRGLGVALPEAAVGVERPEIRLYLRLAHTYGDDAHARYNALIRRLVSFERGLELWTRLERDRATR